MSYYVFANIFGNCPQVKILETFVENYNEELYLTELERMTGISKITISDHLNKLQYEGIIEKTRQDGRIQYYKLNLESPKAKILLLLEKYIESEKLHKLLPKTECIHTQGLNNMPEQFKLTPEMIAEIEEKVNTCMTDLEKKIDIINSTPIGSFVTACWVIVDDIESKKVSVIDPIKSDEEDSDDEDDKY